MMTSLRYWSPVGFALLALGVAAGLPTFSSKWSHVVVGFLVLPLLWSFHYIQKQPTYPRNSNFWVWGLALLGLVSALLAPNPYTAVLGWVVLVAGLVIFQLDRSFTVEHRPVVLVGLVVIGVTGAGLSLLATKTGLNIPWLPPIGKDPLGLAAFVLLPLASGVILFKRQAVWKQFALALSCVVLIIPLVSPSFFQQIKEQWNTTSSLAPATASMFTQHWWAGVGLNNYTYVYPQYAVDASILSHQAPNTLWDILVSTGVFSSLAFVGLLIVSLAGLRHLPSKKMRVILLVTIVSFFILFWFGNLWQYPAVLLAFWLLLGLSASPLPTQENQAGTRPATRWVTLGLGVVFALQSIVMALGLNRFAAAERAANAGDTKTAVTLYDQSLRFDPDPEQRRAYAESLWLTGHSSKDFGEAERQARRAMQWNRADAYSRQVAARIAFSQEHFADAERVYRETLARDPWFSLDAYVAFADVYKKQDKVREEKAVLDEALSRFSEAIRQRGLAFPAMRDQLERIQQRRTALE